MPTGVEDEAVVPDAPSAATTRPRNRLDHDVLAEAISDSASLRIC